MKRKRDKIDGQDPWEIEVAALAEQLKLKPADARDIVAIRWMHRGDLRPLAALPQLDGVVFSELRKMINAGATNRAPRTWRTETAQQAHTRYIHCGSIRNPRWQV